MSNETTDISSEIEKIAKEGQAEKAGARKFRFPDFTIFLWGWFFISLLTAIPAASSAAVLTRLPLDKCAIETCCLDSA